MNESIPTSKDFTTKYLEFAVVATRWLLGIQCLMSGSNWFYKILPFPNIFDPAGLPVKAEIVRTMIESGWMFTAAKLIEIALGLALVLNRFVPLMLVVSFPVIFMTFIIDALIWQYLAGFIMGSVPWSLLSVKLIDAIFWGGACMVMQVFLMFSYFDYYRPMLSFRAEPRF